MNKRVGIGINSMNELFIYRDNVSLLSDNIGALHSNTEVLVKAGGKINGQVNIKKIENSLY